MRTKIALAFVLALAFFLRFYNLGNYPALNADEAALGYNAYSLLETGRDEHGNPWPIHFQSFNDYKPGLYVYLTLPFVKLFGLSVLPVRFPGALLGVVTVFLVYLLAKQLFTEKNKADLTARGSLTGLVAALFIAISPWHIHFSRGAWEVNAATTFILLGVYLTISFLQKKIWLKRFFAAMSFIAAMYAYHAARIVVPLILVGIDVFYWKQLEITKHIKKYMLIILLSSFVLLPLLRDMLGPAGLARATGVSIFSDPGVVARIEEQRNTYSNPNSIKAKLLHNRPVNYSIEFIENWLQHYSSAFLFIQGDEIQRNKVPAMGQMYIYSAILLSIGLLSLIKSKTLNHSTKLVLLWWLAIAPSAAAITFQSPHALRAQNMVVPLEIISAYGFVSLVYWLKHKAGNIKVFGIYILLLCIIIFSGLTKYIDRYWNYMAKDLPFSSQYGVKEMVEYVAKNQSKYSKVFITTVYDQPYVLYLFYTKIDPRVFQANHTLAAKNTYGFSTVAQFNTLHFQPIDFTVLASDNPNSLFVGTPDEIPDDTGVIKEIYGPNGFKYFEVASN